MKTSREMAYLYDLYIVPTWRDCFDQMFNEHIGLPAEGYVLDVNCGTGGHALEIAKTLAEKGEVTAIDESDEMIELARGKAQVLKADNIEFMVGGWLPLPFRDNRFDLVLADASFIPPNRLDNLIGELRRVVKPKSKIVISLATRGSFDEFFSIYWEALYECNLSEQLLPSLEVLINARPTIADVEEVMKVAGLKSVNNYLNKEELFYDDAEQFFTSPLIADFQLEEWLAILPPAKVKSVKSTLVKIIDRERAGHRFDVSIKASIFSAEKGN